MMKEVLEKRTRVFGAEHHYTTSAAQRPNVFLSVKPLTMSCQANL